jgi:hypothetical protein
MTNYQDDLLDRLRFGTERVVSDLGNGIAQTVIKKIRNYEIVKTYKQFKVRVKVMNPKEETVEYIKHTDKIRKLHAEKRLLISDSEDPTLAPTFMIDYPKTDKDGSYFVISAWTEVVV